MRHVHITRTETGPYGTFGELITDSYFRCKSLELPYVPESPVRSCLPAGDYICTKNYSERLKASHYHIDAPVKSGNEIVFAHWAGDTSLGHKCDLVGALAIGQDIVTLEGQKALQGSRSALIMLEFGMNDMDFELTIRWAEGIGPSPDIKTGGTNGG